MTEVPDRKDGARQVPCVSTYGSDVSRPESSSTRVAETAHEMNNVLIYVHHNLELAIRAAQGRAPCETYLESLLDAEDGLARLTILARRLLHIGRDESLSRNSIDVRPVLDRAVRIVVPRLRPGIQVERHYREVPMVAASEVDLTQVFVNLLLNSIEANDSGDSADLRLRLSTAADVNGCARIEVEDNGKGIPPDTMRRIFDTFYTTKRTGSGLGLAFSRRVVTTLGGAIRASSEPGRTSFVITLPGNVSSGRDRT